MKNLCTACRPKKSQAVAGFWSHGVLLLVLLQDPGPGGSAQRFQLGEGRVKVRCRLLPVSALRPTLDGRSSVQSAEEAPDDAQALGPEGLHEAVADENRQERVVLHARSVRINAGRRQHLQALLRTPHLGEVEEPGALVGIAWKSAARILQYRLQHCRPVPLEGEPGHPLDERVQLVAFDVPPCKEGLAGRILDNAAGRKTLCRGCHDEVMGETTLDIHHILQLGAGLLRQALEELAVELARHGVGAKPALVLAVRTGQVADESDGRFAPKAAHLRHRHAEILAYLGREAAGAHKHCYIVQPPRSPRPGRQTSMGRSRCGPARCPALGRCR
mmetsp:Transcript_67899/g.214798  ORF Transcript_67899/g.214798 Transcript_67899/m.214798 type:complete len:331 (+) Transcript_67899:13-1005(+)